MLRSLFYLFVLSCFLSSCGGEAIVTPKPRAYPKIEYPAKRYQLFDRDICDFQFEYPTYARIVQDSAFLEERTDGNCWFDVYFPSFNGRLHCSYFPIGGDKSFEDLKKDAFEMVDYHNKRANYIDELSVKRAEEKVEGFVFAIEGPAATPFQFYLTDKEEHFIRASLYFNTEVRPDSIAPIYEFVRQDMMKMIETFKWGD